MFAPENVNGIALAGDARAIEVTNPVNFGFYRSAVILLNQTSAPIKQEDQRSAGAWGSRALAAEVAQLQRVA